MEAFMAKGRTVDGEVIAISFNGAKEAITSGV